MFDPGYDGFLGFASAVGLDLEDFQREIAHCLFDGPRELLVMLPRGNGKTTLMAAIAVHHLLTWKDPVIYCGAASVDQARLLLDAAKGMARQLPDSLRLRVLKLEIRREDHTGIMRMVPSHGQKAHGPTPSLALIDELHAHRDAGLYEAMRSAMPKRADMRMVTISTADTGDDRPLCRLRARALDQPTVERRGDHVVCLGPSLQALLWEVADGVGPDDLEAIAAVNPASWITPELLAEQREALPEVSYLRYHANGRIAEGSWLPPGAWSACIGSPDFEPGESIWVGCDIGGTEAATAVVWVNQTGHVGCWIKTAEDAILGAVERVRELQQELQIEEFVFDPWRARQAALELEAEGVRCVEFAQSEVRMAPASAGLRSAITEERLVLPNHPDLNRHAANAVAKHGRRGWRIDSPGRGIQIDGVIALCMANERREHQPAPAQFFGWVV